MGDRKRGLWIETLQLRGCLVESEGREGSFGGEVKTLLGVD